MHAFALTACTQRVRAQHRAASAVTSPQRTSLAQRSACAAARRVCRMPRAVATPARPQAASPGRSVSPLDVALFVPNVICYARAALLLGVCASAAVPVRAAALYVVCFALDGVDGFAARSLHQSSSFGAFLDVAVDNAGRALMWALSGAPAAAVAFFPALEGLALAATHARAGAAWKSVGFAAAPASVAWLMQRGFRTPQGAVLVAGLHFLPLALFLHHSGAAAAVQHTPAWRALLALLVLGRALALCAEVWVLAAHTGMMLRADAAERSVTTS